MKQFSKEKKFVTLFIAAIILMICLSACVTEKQRLKICNSCAVKTESKETVKIIHDTVPVEVPGKPGPTIYLENPCKWLCDSFGNLKKDFSKQASKNGVNLFIASQGNGLIINTEKKDTTLRIPVTNTMTAKVTTESYIKYVTCENERTNFDGFCRWFFYIIGPLLCVYFVLKYWLRLPI